MNFKNLEIKEEYNSISDDVYKDFFNKILSCSKRYARVGGLFTSRNFAACADGLQDFIQNDGHMELVLLPSFTFEDVEAIEKGIKTPDQIISEGWIKDFTEINDKFVLDHTKALAWMLAKEYLTIKIVVPSYSNGKIIPKSELEKVHVFKRKTGIFWDENYDVISFTGNIDFDDKVFGEYYFFRVFRSWDESEKKYLDDDFEEFQKYWEGKTIEENGFKVKTISLPSAIRENLIEIAPKSKSEIQLHKSPKLRRYQEKAVSKWFENDKKGIFEMATGTGKTFTAIGCIKEIQKLEKPFLVVIACPFDNLERQWKDELEKWEIESSITSKDPKWHINMRDSIASLESGKQNSVHVIITSYTTFHSEQFVDSINLCKVPVMLIADEVHNAGSTENLKGLVEGYSFRLGLSATLERYFDPIGTASLSSFFGETVFSLDLEEAIKNNFLVGYYYYPIYVDLIPDEYIEYRRLTAKIAQLWDSKEPEAQIAKEIALQQRARIIRDAQNKISAFEDFVSNNPKLKYTLIYCSEKQMDVVKQILNNAKPKPIINREITAKNPKDPRDRGQILRDLANEKYAVLVANRVLDEGADIPEAKSCVMLASTGNPKQFIQRRGRVLRKFNETYPDGSKKEYAIIYDILVIPELSPTYTDYERTMEQGIVESQLRRQEQMARIAINKDSCLEEVRRIKNKFGVN